MPELIRRYRTSDVDAQRVKWIPERWGATSAGHEAAHADLTAHSQEAGGIARSSIHAQSQRDPVDLFLMAMACDPLGALRRLDRHAPLVEVDALPFEPECLTPPQTHRQRNRPQCIQSVLFCGP